MHNYEIKKENRAFIKPFIDYVAVESWAFGYFGEGYTITDLGPIPTLSDEEKLDERIDEGYKIYREYLSENNAIAKQLGRPFTVEETDAVTAKMQPIQTLLLAGSFVQAVAKLQLVEADALFPQERKDKYINRIQGFIDLQNMY
jgi:hypothetical protein